MDNATAERPTTRRPRREPDSNTRTLEALAEELKANAPTDALFADTLLAWQRQEKRARTAERRLRETADWQAAQNADNARVDADALHYLLVYQLGDLGLDDEDEFGGFEGEEILDA